MTIAESLMLAAQKLRDAGVAQPEREAASLLMFTLGRDRTFLFAHNEYKLTTDESITFDRGVARREAREPFQHIVGKQEFYGLDFEVSPDVLIPRPETELLVEAAVDAARTNKITRILEVGTGSGCIVISVLHSVPTATATAVDISQKALEIAMKNAVKHAVAERIEFLISDIYDAIGDGRFDVIVSNPPYIPADDIPELQAEVRDFDPITALTDGADGLSIIRRIVADAPRFLSKDGEIMIEIGFGQAADVREMFDRDIWLEPLFINDLQGIARVVIVRLR